MLGHAESHTAVSIEQKLSKCVLLQWIYRPVASIVMQRSYWESRGDIPSSSCVNAVSALAPPDPRPGLYLGIDTSIPVPTLILASRPQVLYRPECTAESVRTICLGLLLGPNSRQKDQTHYTQYRGAFVYSCDVNGLFLVSLVLRIRIIAGLAQSALELGHLLRFKLNFESGCTTRSSSSKGSKPLSYQGGR